MFRRLFGAPPFLSTLCGHTRRRRLPVAALLATTLIGATWSVVTLPCGSDVVLFPDDEEAVAETDGDIRHGEQLQWWPRMLLAAPLRAVSRAWGRAMCDTDLPRWLRSPVYMAYAKAFGCNLDDLPAHYRNDLTQFRNLGAFFDRPIDIARVRPSCGAIAASTAVAKMVSPCDGYICATGTLVLRDETTTTTTTTIDAAAIAVPNVKGYAVPLHQLTGGPHRPHPPNGQGLDTGNRGKNTLSAHSKKTEPVTKKQIEYHYAVIYLAPGDYHRVHAPTQTEIDRRSHTPGRLVPVSPSTVRILPRLYALNERVGLHGTWAHGALHLVLVGATNVGSIRLVREPQFRTNLVHQDKDAVLPLANPTQEKFVGSFQAIAACDDAPQQRVTAKQEFCNSLGSLAVERHSPVAAAAAPSLTPNSSALPSNVSIVNIDPKTIGSYVPMEEVGGFLMGSTVVLLFEGPLDKSTEATNGFRWAVTPGQPIKVGQPLIQW